MAELLATCARQLLEGAPGGEQQRVANVWLMQFQAQPEAWDAALQLLQNLPQDATTRQAPELVAVQLLRLKTQREWTRISAYQQQLVRQTLLNLLHGACMGDALAPVSRRIACVTLADVVVKSYQDWPGWKSDVQKLVDAGVAAQRQQCGAAVLADVLGAIPLQIVGSERLWTVEQMQETLTTFQNEAEDVMTAVNMILTGVPDERGSALRCLEGWIIGCVPTYETFGLTAAHLFSSGLLDVLFDIVVGEDEEQSKLAAGIIADSFVYTVSAPASDAMINAVVHAGCRLVNAIPVFNSEVRSPSGGVMSGEQQAVVCRGVSLIACSLAMNHAPTLFSSRMDSTLEHGRNHASGEGHAFALRFLDLLLACSSHKDIDVVQPTLEIWFFFLEDNSSQNEVSMQLLSNIGEERVTQVLSQLVNALIERCKYPQWFVDSQQVASDDPDIEAISNLRREIADTLLSLFSKWPGGGDKPRGDYVSCVKGMAQLLSDSTDVALVDALLFLLSYLVELFDVISSDSESEDDPISFETPATGGVDVLLGILDCTPQLPMHPLVVSSIARYLKSLAASLALPPNLYLRASLVICQGLQFPTSFPVAVQSLLQCSSPIAKYTNVDERAPLLQTLLAFSSSLTTRSSQESEGDLLELIFRIAGGASDADFEALCSSVLAPLILRIQSQTSSDISTAVYLLGRALGGVQDKHHGHALVSQLWPLASTSLLHYKTDDACRRAGVQFFLNIIPLLDKDDLVSVEAQMLEMCLSWYSQSIAPDILMCCSQMVEKQRGNPTFQATASQVYERLLAGFRIKLHECTDSASSTMENFLLHDRHADLMIPEVEQFMLLTRQVLSSFPQVLLHDSQGKATIYWVCLDLATRLIKVDHQMQEVCDAACDFLLETIRCQPTAIMERVDVFTREIVRVLLGFLGPKREHYRVRNIWDFLFQCLHAPQISAQIRAHFQSAISTVVLEEGALRSVLPEELWQRLPNEVRTRRQRHRFRQYFSQLVLSAV